MIEIRFRKNAFARLKSHLIRSGHADEEGALLLVREVESPGRRVLLIVDVLPVPDAGLMHKGPGGLIVDPEFLAPVIKRARADGLGVLITHSHPFSDQTVGFSSIDDRGEHLLMPKLLERIPNRTHGAIVFGKRSLAARVWLPGHNSSVAVDLVRQVGSQFEVNLLSRNPATEDERFARQVLAFSAAGQSLLRTLRIAIVGLGGIGSQVFQNLLHLGVRDFVLIDHDRVERSNLSRLVGATYEDAVQRRSKVEVMARLGKAFDPDVEIAAVMDNVYHQSAAARLPSVDVAFCCTDTMVSRMVLTRLPKQYFIPLIDVGVNIQVVDGAVSRIGGRVMVLGPEDPCLDCLEYLDHDALTRELAAAGVVAPTPYVTGAEEPAASVVSYNATLAGLAVSEFLRLAIPGFPPAPSQTFQVLDGIDGIVRRVSLPTSRHCGVCDDLVGAGDSAALPVLKDR